ncbi:hypothetical protein MVES_003493 [Malassezia vespertilionis]|uniref:Selenoprotein O n=2 Tax=Malassezia vespertilionis TaxID=2020962 RepID=A0A2N1J844_9BASI|nr:hypothetical protein MVES_003493 [Malassezia vespertilionis]
MTANLLADPVTPFASSLVACKEAYPTLLRRVRHIKNGAHFTYVTPLPLAFPYDFPPDEAQGKNEGDETASTLRRVEEVENIIRSCEVALPHNGKMDPIPPWRHNALYPSARLLAISPHTHRDCLPELDLGDAAAFIAQSSGQSGKNTFSSGPISDALHKHSPDMYAGATDAVEARRAFSDWAAGRAIYIDPGQHPIPADAGTGVRFFQERDTAEKEKWSDEKLAAYEFERSLEELEHNRTDSSRPYGPWSLRYGGHQFGEWAGQLGDGRAVTLLESAHPNGDRFEVQIKGAGRTPYSRFGDGLATQKSSMREFLASEYMAALHIPTSRSLCVVGLPELAVARESLTTAAVNMRIASSWLRIGNFQIHSSRGEWESVRILGEFVAHVIFGWDDVAVGGTSQHRPPWAERLLYEVARRNARTCARWQVYGFMHGVLNTDNIALTGETIDYGPYGFMDVFDEAQICNHSDYSGRYSFRLQPTMILYAMDKLLEAIAFVIGFEKEHGRALRKGELSRIPLEQIQKWSDFGVDACADKVSELVQHELLEEWALAWCARLGVPSRGAETDKAQLIDPLLVALPGLDFSLALRYLCAFPDTVERTQDAADAAAQFAENWVRHALLPRTEPSDEQLRVATSWLTIYATWLMDAARPAALVAQELCAHNPRFVLRNWITDEVAERLETRQDTLFFERVRAMCDAPFAPWGEVRDGVSAEDAEEERRLCAIGSPLSSNLPSCSS